MRRHLSGRRRAVGVFAWGLWLSALSSGVVWTPPAEALALKPGSDCTQISDTDTESEDDTDPSQPIEDLEIDEAHELLKDGGFSLGGKSTVAVVDSGILPTMPAEVFPTRRVYKSGVTDPNFLFYHGTAVAGLIAGAPHEDHTIGIAPAAKLVDIPVYDTGPGDDGEAKELTEENLIAGLRQIADAPDVGDVNIVNISLAVPGSPELKAVIDDITERNIIVVAAAGNRPGSTDEPFGNDFSAEPEPGEDAAKTIYPAGYAATNPLVVAVTSTASGDESKLILPNSAATVAAPSAQAASYAVNGTACRLAAPATSFAAAEVSGVLALLHTRFPNEDPAQLIARMTDTAAGSGLGDPSDRGRTIGSGIVQPVEALSRRLTPTKDGDVGESVLPRSRPTPVTVDPPAPDQLASTRRNAVWWGLGGGGALVIALLLRPVLARRRSTR